MVHEYKIKKGKHYFKGYKFQLADFQVTLLILFLVLGSFIHWSFFVAAVASYVVFQIAIFKQLRSVSYTALFYDNCTYKLTENYDQINKLFGVSEMFHHWNSARIGWRCIDNENIELLAYCYVNKRRIYKPLIKIKPGEKVDCSIYIDKYEYVFYTLTQDGVGKICHMPRTSFKLSNLFMYRLYPYFGGSVPSPKYMKLELEKNETRK